MNCNNKHEIESILSMILSENKEDYNLALEILNNSPLIGTYEESKEFLTELYKIWRDHDLGEYPGLACYIVDHSKAINYDIIRVDNDYRGTV